MSLILSAVATLGIISAISAAILYLVSQQFKVEEDPRIGEVLEILPNANCGGCGFPGCSSFAAACAKANSLDSLYCSVGGAEVMNKVASILGAQAPKTDKKIAVVRCNGTCENRPRTNYYDGYLCCAVASSLYGGMSDCSFGCLGLGDCVRACTFDAIHINLETMLPQVDEEECTACGACVKVCPKSIIELRKQGPKSRRIFVSCINKDKGAVARKACKAACIGCGKCAKECPFEAITVENNLAYIDDSKCRLCRKCVAVCPTGSIWALNFPLRKKPAEEQTTNANI